MARPLKILFVAHTVDPMGGAARSLRELLRAWDGIDADIMLHRFNGLPDDATVREWFGPRVVRSVFRDWLPYDMCYRGRPSLWQSPRRHLLFPLAWRANRRRFRSFVERRGYDAVHLNSVVLHPMVDAARPFILHVREIVDRAQPRVLASAAAAAGVVFIDEATRAPFANLQLRAGLVLNNPVDMRAVGTPPRDAAARLDGDPATLTVFAIVGSLIPEKGVDVVIEAFRRVDAVTARLLVVGDGDRDYTTRLARLAAGDRRIVFWGSEPDVAALYTLSDYVVRGEAYHCVGRTIYEALYAGCGAIVPGEAADHHFFEYERFADSIQLYRPSDREALAQIFRANVGRKRTAKVGSSNVAAYATEFDRFVRAALGKRQV